MSIQEVLNKAFTVLNIENKYRCYHVTFIDVDEIKKYVTIKYVTFCGKEFEFRSTYLYLDIVINNFKNTGEKNEIT